MTDLPTRQSSSALIHPVGEGDTLYAVLRSVTWRGPWEPPELMRASSILAQIVLDYSDAPLPEGVTTVECQVWLGNIEIIVPPGVDVEVNGSVLLGNVEVHDDRSRRAPPGPSEGRDGEPEAESERPLLSLDCSGLMGNVEVQLL